MDTISHTHRAPKRRKTGKGRRGITEGDEITADGILVRTVTSQAADGSVREVTSRPVWLHEEIQSPRVTEAVPEDVPVVVGPDPDIQMECGDEAELTNMPNITRTSKTQQYYLQEFVKRVHPMLAALLAREVPEKTTCSHCAGGHVARWRCRDCTAASMMCRGCMREMHCWSPLHHIEIWTGTCFRRAQLWQVGTYILIPHVSGERVCPTLAWNQKLLDDFQRIRDTREQAELMQGWPNPESAPPAPEVFTEIGTIDEDQENGVDSMSDREFDDHLENLYARNRGPTADGQTGEAGMEAEAEAGEDDEVPLIIPADYIPILQTTNGPDDNPTRMPDPTRMSDPMRTSNMQAPLETDIPRTDALDNPFIRVVHTNGIHHIAVVSCSCRGRENTHCDLMAARLIPTSFDRYRTMFTHAVLDDFRLDNLECKASAYQYFQKLRRLTSATAPDSVPNLYHELRRMSRVWRWMKKLKWAGTVHTATETAPVPGDLANFCPTCPQSGINLPVNWKLDSNKCVKS